MPALRYRLQLREADQLSPPAPAAFSRDRGDRGATVAQVRAGAAADRRAGPDEVPPAVGAVAAALQARPAEERAGEPAAAAVQDTAGEVATRLRLSERDPCPEPHQAVGGDGRLAAFQVLRRLLRE